MEQTLYELALEQLLQITDIEEFDRRFISFIQKPKNEIIVNFPCYVRGIDDQICDVIMIKGYRIQHNNLMGPYKGGIRFSNFVRLDEVKGLAFLMMIKTSLLELPLGGGKGGVKINPLEYTDKDLRRIAQGYSKAIHRFIGSDIDIPAPDMGTDARMMDIMTAQYQSVHRTHANDMFTGKSVGFGGSKTRKEATGTGLVICIEKYFRDRGETLNNFTVQGFGNVGSHAAMRLWESGKKCIGLGDHTGYIYSENGFDLERVNEYVQRNRSLKGYCDKRITKEEFLGLSTDLLILAACEFQVCGEEAKLLNCKVVAEGANGPIDVAADRILEERKIVVLPDVLVNSGGVFVSYLEWVGNRKKMRFTAEEEREQLRRKMERKFEEMSKVANSKGISYRKATFLIAVRNLWYHYDRKHGD